MRTRSHIDILNRRLKLFYEHLMSDAREFLLQWKARTEAKESGSTPPASSGQQRAKEGR